MTPNDKNRRGFLGHMLAAAAAVSLPLTRLHAAPAAAPPSGQDDWMGEVAGKSYKCFFDFPQHKNGFGLLHILNYIGTYGEFILARVLLKGTEQYTLMVGLERFAGAQIEQRWGVFAAGALIGALPIMIIYVVLQDQIVGGLTQGAVKG